MEKKIILTPNAPSPIGPYSQAVFANSTLYCSGQIALDTSGKFHNETVESESKQVMENIKQVLKAANLDFSNIVKTSIFLTDMNDFNAVNAIYSSYFNNANYPARETVQVSALPKGAKVEISIIACP